MHRTRQGFIYFICILFASCAIYRPTVTKVTDDYFMVAHPLKYSSSDSKYDVIVPVGFFTDLTSIPRSLWWWESPIDKSMAPAIVHDYLYWEQPCSKKEADVILYLALGDAGMDDAKRWLIYKGVDLAGQDSWDKNTKARRAGETRFVSEAYARELQNTSIDPRATLQSVIADASGKGAALSPVPPASLKETCAAAMKAFNKHQKF